jgi:hypothetical protein
MGVLLRWQRHDVARRQHRDADSNTGTWSQGGAARAMRHTNARSCRGGCTLCRDRRPVGRWRRVRGCACDGKRKSSSRGVGHTHVVPPERNGPFRLLGALPRSCRRGNRRSPSHGSHIPVSSFGVVVASSTRNLLRLPTPFGFISTLTLSSFSVQWQLCVLGVARCQACAEGAISQWHDVAWHTGYFRSRDFGVVHALRCCRRA